MRSLVICAFILCMSVASTATAQDPQEQKRLYVAVAAGVDQAISQFNAPLESHTLSGTFRILDHSYASVYSPVLVAVMRSSVMSGA